MEFRGTLFDHLASLKNFFRTERWFIARNNKHSVLIPRDIVTNRPFEGKALREISAQMVEKFKMDRLNTQT